MKKYLTLVFLFLFTITIKISSQDIANDLDSLLNMKISTASKYWQTISEAPASITIISSKEIEAYGYKTLSEALNTVRGLYISDDKNYNYLGIRGFSRPTDYINRILILLNGHTTNDNIYGGTCIGGDFAIDINSIDRIEIVRGPSSVLYGTSAMLAIINVITKESNLKNNFYSSVEVGSFKRLKGSFNLSHKFSNGLNFFLSGMMGDVKGESLYFEEFDTDSTNYGKAENLDWEKNYGLFLSSKYGDFSFNGYYSHRKKGIPTASYGINFNDSRANTIDENGFLEIKYNNALSNNVNLMLRSYFDHNYYNGIWPYDIIQYDKSQSNSIGLEGQFIWDVLENYRITFGGELKDIVKAYYKTGDQDSIYYFNNFPYNAGGLYFQNEFQLYNNLSVNFGLRWDDYSHVNSVLSPRAALLYYPFRTSTVKLLYGEAYRLPNLYELYIVDPINGYWGNPNLKSENIKTVELTWEEKINKHLFGSISLFNYTIKNLIDSRLILPDSIIKFVNSDKVSTNGIEAELNTKLINGINSFINYSFQYAKDNYSGKKISNSPSHLVKFGIIYPFTDNIFLASDMLFESQRLTAYETETKPYFLVNTNLMVKNIFNHFNIQFKINNLLNSKYKLPGGLEHLQKSIIQPYRSYNFKLEYYF